MILLTLVFTSGIFTPLLFEKSLQAQFLKPMAITIVFGLLAATFLVLILIPALIFIGSELKQIIFGSKSWEEVEQRKQ